jgi:iron complex transport system substrate-binding protein
MDQADAVSVNGRDSGLVIGDSTKQQRAASDESAIADHQSPRSGGPQRIVCLTEEPTEVLYALGEQHRIVGISGFTVRPPVARRAKPKVSAVTSARIDELLRLRPDFVIGFSDIQADIAAALIRHGIEVWISNHRSVDGIIDYVRRLGALVGVAGEADAYATRLREGLDAIAGDAARLPRRPKVYFEEWDEPLISGIQWVAELVRIAGGDDIFPERAAEALARQRILEDPDEVVRRAPDIVFGSWCGKKFRPEKVAARAGWSSIPAVRDGELHEIKSPIILQPGPAALTDGVAEIARIISAWAARQGLRYCG